MMNTLEMYKRLSGEDKKNLTIYSIYDSIYSVARNEEVVKDIQELSYDLYLDDDYYDHSSIKISDFITRCYLYDNESLEKISDMDYSDILQAIDEDNIYFYTEELQR